MRARLGGVSPRIKQSESVGLYRKSAIAGEDEPYTYNPHYTFENESTNTKLF